MKRSKKLTRTALLAVLFAFVLAATGLAWYFTASTLELGRIDGGVDYLANYFESGDGTQTIVYDASGAIIEGPFEIAHPDQLYNLAWLQYMGYFNEDEDEDGVVDTVYFRISTDLDMTGFVLPPIGTQDNPFLGALDGEGHTVSNLKISNVVDTNQLVAGDLPLEIQMKENSEVHGVEIIGFFGVVGSLPDDTYTYDTQANEIKNLTLNALTVETQTSQALIGLAAGYVNGTLSNVGVQASTITVGVATPLSYTTNMSDWSLVGYCTDDYKTMAKLVSTEDLRYLVGVQPQLINQELDANTTGDDNTWGGSIDMQSMYTRLNTIFGYNAATTVRYVSARTDTYLDGVFQSSNNTAANTASDYKVYSADGVGSFTFHTQSGQYMYVNGERDLMTTVTPVYQYSGYKIQNNGSYLYASSNTAVTGTTNVNTASVWVYDETEHTLYTYRDNTGTKYYLRWNGSALSLSTTTSTEWTYEEEEERYYFGDTDYALHYLDGAWVVTDTEEEEITCYYLQIGNYGYLRSTGTGTPTVVDQANASKWEQVTEGNYNYYRLFGTSNWLRYNARATPVYVSASTTTRYRQNGNYLHTGTYYLYYNNGTWTRSTNNRTQVTLVPTSETIALDKTIARTAAVGQYTGATYTEPSGTKTNPTYYPLAVQDASAGNYAVSEKNTGYVMSGNVNQYGDIRVSYYAKNTNIGNSLSNNKMTTVYTHTVDGGFHMISEDTDSGFKNYWGDGGVKARMEALFAQSTNVYGLHFMNASIGSHYITIPDAVINGTHYTNYMMPSDCIDFSLKDAGFITFLAGTYYNTAGANNDSFFSLHQIFRNGSGSITGIREIAAVYKNTEGDGDGEYIYAYAARDGGGYSRLTYDDDGNAIHSVVNTAPASVTSANLLFDTNWITNPTTTDSRWYDKYLYYYEIPMNRGEYALGSVEGRNGAYLLYLDIGANGRMTSENAWIGATADVQVTETRTNRYGIPAGVDFVPVAGTVGDPDGTAALTGTGSTVFTRSGDTITANGTNGQTVNYLMDDGTWVKAGGTSATLTEPEVTPEVYNETDTLQNGSPAFDTYGINSQVVTKTVTVRVHDDNTNIEDQFTFTYSYTNTGSADVDPVTVSYADPLIYMIQYDSSRLTSAPAITSVETGFKGTIYIGLAGDNSVLTQYNGTKTLRPSDKVYFEAYPATELFRVNEDPASTNLAVSYNSVLDNSDKSQAFTYTVTGTALETPEIADANSGCAVTSSSTSSAVLTFTLIPEDPNGNRQMSPLNVRPNFAAAFSPALSPSFSPALSPSLSPVLGRVDAVLPETVDDKTDDADTTKFDGELDGEPDSAEEEFIYVSAPIIAFNGSRKEVDPETGVTRYYEYFEEEGGWILVLETYPIDPETGEYIIPEPIEEDEDEPDEEAPDGEVGDETGGETGDETGEETGDETGAETGSETGSETGEETGGETGAETGDETGGETGDETGAETGSETGEETGDETGAETGSEPDDETGNETESAADPVVPANTDAEPAPGDEEEETGSGGDAEDPDPADSDPGDGDAEPETDCGDSPAAEEATGGDADA